jgi:proton glutamate symport protein
MRNKMFPTQRGKSRLFVALSLAGLMLWLMGIAAGLAAQTTAGVTLRSLSILLFFIAILRRPSLMAWTFLAMLAGVELGMDAPNIASRAHFLGDLFLRLIRMIVAPLVFATITTGIAGHSQLRNIGRVAVKALIFFEVVTTLGLILGTVAMNLSGAGWGITLPAAQVGLPAVQSMQTWQQIVVGLFPENIAQAVAQNQILQVAMLPNQKRVPLISVLQSLADTIFQLTRFIMVLAPLAAGAALAYTVGGMGLVTLLPLAKLALTCYAALAAFVLLVMLPVLLVYRISVRRFVAAVGEPAAIAFATTSSEAALPLAMENMEKFGVPRWIVSFVIPTGYSFNMIGSSVYLSMAAVFTAQAAGIHLSLTQEIVMLATLVLASKGVAGVPRAVLVVLLATASAIHIPATPILLILGIDPLMDMGRSMMNVVGNCLASVVVARSEGALTQTVLTQ